MRFSDVLRSLHNAIKALAAVDSNALAAVKAAFVSAFEAWANGKRAAGPYGDYAPFDVAGFVSKLPPQLAAIGGEVALAAHRETSLRGMPWAREFLAECFVTYVFTKTPPASAPAAVKVAAPPPPPPPPPAAPLVPTPTDAIEAAFAT
jgi:hypothetical protein